MNLFSNEDFKAFNHLPQDGEAYYASFLDKTMADSYLDYLLGQIPWQNDEVLMFGKLIVTKRKVAWFGDEGIEYTYSKKTKKPLPWTSELLELKRLVEQKTDTSYNSCLLNLYHNGGEGMSWHSDDEKELKKHGSIASLSFGAARKFAFKHKTTKKTLSLILEHGSLLLMQGTIQDHWLHQLPTTTKVSIPRINLTFRTIV